MTDDTPSDGGAAPDDGGGGDRERGTFLVTAADEDSAVLRNVESGRVFTLSSNPGVELHDAVTGAVAPDPPLEVTWRLVEIDRRWRVALERSEESPTAKSAELAAEQDVGDLARMERAGTGEVHVLTVPPERTDQAVTDVLDDEEVTRARAARLGVNRVEVRAADGVVSVRYVP